MESYLIVSSIIYCRKRVIISCDGKCNKAWGINGKANFLKRLFFKAPDDPGTYEGGEGKNPLSHNKWCVRECERSVLKDK